MRPHREAHADELHRSLSVEAGYTTMCGIAGIIPGRFLPDERKRELISAMIEALAHRGPDDRGAWCGEHVVLGHTRLSIIDLSPAGHQPMSDRSGRYQIVYNGEVYNYIELRRSLEARGYAFRSETDTEVLLNAYIEWGARALDRLNGMWAFAIWDQERSELFAARDRAGKKPFYYVAGADGGLHFASEMKALFAVGLRVGLNPQAAFDFLTQGTYGHLGRDGFFSGVAQLPPGHFLRTQLGEPPEVTRYWDLPLIAPKDRLPYDERFRERFRDILTDAVSIRLRSDVPVGATLSGGLDSSTIVTLVDKLTEGAPLHLFTSLYPGTIIDETPFFEAVVARLRRPVVHHAVPPTDGFRERLQHVLHHQEEPFGDTSIFSHFHLMEAARAAGVPVVLSGQGGDELLLGYPSMVRAYLGHLLARGRIGLAMAEMRAWSRSARTSWARTLVASGLHSVPLALRDPIRARYVSRLARIVSPALRARASFLRFDPEEGRGMLDSYLGQVFKRFSIPHLTHYDDRNAMAFSVEGRMPFLDYRLIELLFSVEYDALFHAGFTKRVLRESFADLLPPAVRNRRDKVGFYSPLATWLRGDIEWISSYMTRERMEHVGVLEPSRYLRRLQRLRDGDNSGELEVWRGFIYHLWVDHFSVTPLSESGRVSSLLAKPAVPLANTAREEVSARTWCLDG